MCYDNFVSIIGCNLTRLYFKYLVEEKPKRVVGKQPLRSHRERCWECEIARFSHIYRVGKSIHQNNVEKEKKKTIKSLIKK